MLKIGLAALVALPVLSGCAGNFFPEQDGRIERISLTPASREALHAYFLRKDAKAFVFDAETGEGLYRSGLATIAEAEAEALDRCAQLNGSACMVFALNNQIVWQEADMAGIEPVPEPDPLRRTTRWVNMRTGPGTQFAVIDVLAPEETLEVTGARDIWQAVRRADGSIGYVHGKFLRAITPAGGPTDDAG